MPDPPPTLLDSGGPLLSLDQFVFLMGGASMEGLPLGLETGGSDELKTNSAFQRDWHDLLATIALFGPARVALPAHLAEQMAIEPLIESGIAEIVVIDTTADLRRAIAKTYREAFDRCRELEFLEPTAPTVSLDAPAVTPPGELAKARHVAGDAEFYIGRLSEQISGLVTGLRDIFGYYVEVNEVERLGALREFSDRLYPDPAKISQKDAGAREYDLFESMGLYVRGAEAVNSMSFELKGLAYSPPCLEEFEELSRSLTTPAESFSDFASVGLQLSQFPRDEFFAVHAFWSSFYELTNMLSVSRLTSNQLYLPSAAPVRVGGDKGSVRTAESLRVFRLLLSELGRLPSPTSLADLERLQRDPGLSSLRPLLERWTDETHGSEDPDTDLLEEIRADIARATKMLKHSELLDRTGKVLTFLSLPVAVYDLLEGSALGATLVPVGPAIEAYKASRIRQASWVRLGAV